MTYVKESGAAGYKKAERLAILLTDSHTNLNNKI